MRELIKELYNGSLKDVRKKVSRYEYEMREAAHKVNTAELFYQVSLIRQHLEETGVQLPELDEVAKTTKLIEIIKNDDALLNKDIAETIFDKKLEKRMSMGRGDDGMFGEIRKWMIDKSVATAPINDTIKNNLLHAYEEVDFKEL